MTEVPLSRRSFTGFAREQAAADQAAAVDLATFLASANVDVQGLHPEFRARLTRVIEAIPENLRREIRITSGYRSNEQQAALRARFEAGVGGRAAPAGRSQHNFGKAVDTNWSQMSPAARQAWTQAAQQHGLMNQYSWQGHWGPTGDDGRPWRVGQPLSGWQGRPVATAPVVDSNSARAMGVDRPAPRVAPQQRQAPAQSNVADVMAYGGDEPMPVMDDGGGGFAMPSFGGGRRPPPPLEQPQMLDVSSILAQMPGVADLMSMALPSSTTPTGAIPTSSIQSLDLTGADIIRAGTRLR